MIPSAHADTFARDNLPPQSAWPEFIFELPELRYPERLNIADTLLREAIARGGGDRPAILSPEGTRWSYAELDAISNRIARVLTEDLGVVPGNRVLLRFPNNRCTWRAGSR
jgi:2-aminobenzoate-CoA ligase